MSKSTGSSSGICVTLMGRQELAGETVQGSHFSRHLSSADISRGKAEVWAGTVRDDGSGAMWFSELLPNAFELGFQVVPGAVSTGSKPSVVVKGTESGVRDAQAGLHHMLPGRCWRDYFVPLSLHLLIWEVRTEYFPHCPLKKKNTHNI